MEWHIFGIQLIKAAVGKDTCGSNRRGRGFFLPFPVKTDLDLIVCQSDKFFALVIVGSCFGIEISQEKVVLEPRNRESDNVFAVVLFKDKRHFF